MNRNVFKFLLIHRLSYKRLWYNRPQCYHSMGYWNKQHLSPIQLRLNHNHMNVFWNVRQYSILNHKYQQHHPYILYPSNGFCCSKILSHVGSSILHLLIEWLQINYLFLFVGKFESLWSIWVPEIMVPQSKFQFLTREVASHPLLYSSLTPEILFVSGRVMVVNWLRMPSYIIMLSISNRVVTYHLPGASKYHCY